MENTSQPSSVAMPAPFVPRESQLRFLERRLAQAVGAIDTDGNDSAKGDAAVG